ncbi:MAG: hypothetical protein K6U79_08285 [Firmicutes bacterium]|nr:hypothetical protein [Bacillota bacterium]
MRMQTLTMERRPEPALPLRLMALAAAGLALFSLAAGLLGPGLLAADDGWRRPEALLVVHLATLAWLTPLMMGALYQLVPVVLHLPLAATTWARPLAGLYVAGLALFLTGLAAVAGLPPFVGLAAAPGGAWTWLAAGGSLLLAAILLYLAQMARTLAGLGRAGWSLQAAAVTAALAFLGAVAGWGATLAFNLRWGFLGAAVERQLAVHVTLGLGGWFGSLAMGVGYQLIPMFAPTRHLEERAAPWLLAGWLAGVAGLALLLPLRPGAARLWAPLPAAALAGWALDVSRIVARRSRSQPMPLVTRFSLAAAWTLAAAGLAALATLEGFLPERVAALAGFLGLAGYTLLAVGQMYKIVPFILWQGLYLLAGSLRPSAFAPASPPPPLKSGLWLPERPSQATLPLFLAGLVLLAAGTAAAEPLLLRLGCALWGAAGVASALLIAWTFRAAGRSARLARGAGGPEGAGL